MEGRGGEVFLKPTRSQCRETCDRPKSKNKISSIVLSVFSTICA